MEFLVCVYLQLDKWYNEEVMRRSIKPAVVYLFFLLVIGGLIFSDHQHRRQEDAQVDKVDRTSQASDVEKIRLLKTD